MNDDGCQWVGCEAEAEYRVLPEPGSVTDQPLELCAEHYDHMVRMGMIEPVYDLNPPDPSCIDPTD
jgi:hypothetical protein